MGRGELSSETEGSNFAIQGAGSRLARLSEASLRIHQDLDLETVLQGIVDGARLLTEARYGALLVFDQSGAVQNFLTSGITPEERRLVGHRCPEGRGLPRLHQVDFIPWDRHSWIEFGLSGEFDPMNAPVFPPKTLRCG